MHLRSLRLVAVMVVMIATTMAYAGDLIDEIVATVNGVPIMKSDVEEALRFNALVQRHAIVNATQSEREQALQKLIDQELIRQQIPDGFSVEGSEINQQVAAVRQQIMETTVPDAVWNDTLVKYGLTDQIVRERLRQDLRLLHFIDGRLRPATRIDNDEVVNYYRDILVPQLERDKAPIDPLSTVSDKIREVLVQQRINQMLKAWLSNLRSESEIKIVDSRTVVRSQPESQKLKPANTGK